MVMDASVSEDYMSSRGSSPVEGLSSSQSVESLAEWRSSEQVENGTPSTSPPYWDLDDEDDDDCGPKPSDLYGKFTWKVENFSQSNKRELKSNIFEIGGYKWYILIYPQGCDVCNHLSLFLCVANYDKLLPGWSHFAQFTIAVMNKDPKKNKYSDTLHRFWKKEHDWGWKKFLELAKVMDGFVDNDTLTIRAQVQVIREKAHRPFRCLDSQYRRELIRVYLANVEHNYSQFVKERRDKLRTFVDDKAKWSSFHDFWQKVDQTDRRYMSRDKTDAVLKVVVKHFFIDKEVTSTLVMDSLFTGLKALENQSKIKKVRSNSLEKEECPAPIVFYENDMFVLADDVSVLVERVALELPHPPLPSKEEKGLPNRTKDGCSGDEFSRDSILRDERRLTELGRRTLEIFVLSHIFSSRIEIAYQEFVALKMQEELIREEEAAEQAENEKRERKTKKKQAKQKRNNHRAKDRVKNEKSGGLLNKNQQENCPLGEIITEFCSEYSVQIHEKVGPSSDAGDDAGETLQPDVDGRDASPNIWDTDSSEIQPRAETSGTEIQNSRAEKKISPSMDDSSSTCSTDSVPSVVDNGPYKGNSSPNNKNNRASSKRGKNHRNKDGRNSSTPDADRLLYVSGTSRANGLEPESPHPFKEQSQRPGRGLVEKEEVPVTNGNNLIGRDQVDEEILSKSEKTEPSSSSSAVPSKKPLSSTQSTDRQTLTKKIEKGSALASTSYTKIKPVPLKSEAPKHSIQETNSRATAPSISRPASTPAILTQKPTLPVVPPSPSAPSLSRALSTIVHSAENLQPQSYRNAIMGIRTASNSSTAEFASPSIQSTAFSQPPSSSSSSSSSSSLFSRMPQTAARKEPPFSFGSIGPQSVQKPQERSRQLSHGSQGAVMMQDDFPHLDIINDLLDEDQIVVRTAFNGYNYPLNQQYAFAHDIGTMSGEYYDELSQLVSDSFVPFGGALQPDFSAYGNGMDMLFQSQWPIDGSELSVMGFDVAMDVNGYGYQLPEYSLGLGDYSMMYHQPANGH